MVLVLRAGAEQERALAEFSAGQQDRRSPFFRRWLTPRAFGEHFGVSPRDLAAVIAWLRGYGFTVDPPPAGRRWLDFSGTAAQVEAAFHASVHSFLVNGQLRHASSAPPDIPEALAGVVEGVVSLGDVEASPGRHGVAPQFQSGGAFFLAPYDFAAVYDTIPLYSNAALPGGKGVNIAIVARSNVLVSDVTALAANTSNFGIATPQVVVTPNGDPGIRCNQANPDFATIGCSDWLEATLDVTRAGSVAPQAGVILVPAASTNTTDGLILSAQYIVDHNVAPVVSMSYSICEPAMPPSLATFWSNLWAQAVTEGMSVFVASGDWGADACTPQRQAGATTFQGRAVNGFCTPSVVCVGGTALADQASPASYWSNAGNALGYIPEIAWNETEGSTFATGGGASTLYPKPPWQQALTPADGARDVPDVSVSAAFHDAYVIYIGGRQSTIEGTSASAPSFAGLMALMIASTGSDLPWGNPGPTLYELRQSAQNPFHAALSGGNSVPGVAGFTVTPGPYNQVTGLGSVDAAMLAGAWPAVPLTLGVSHSGTFHQGQNGTYTIVVTTTARPTSGAISVVDSLPQGLAMVSMSGAGWNCSTTAASGTCTRGDSLAANGNYSIIVTVSVGGPPSPATNSVGLTGGGSIPLTAQDPTTVVTICDASSPLQILREALGTAAPNNNLSGSGTVNVIDVQIEVNAAKGLGCGAK